MGRGYAIGGPGGDGDGVGSGDTDGVGDTRNEWFEDSALVTSISMGEMLRLTLLLLFTDRSRGCSDVPLNS